MSHFLFLQGLPGSAMHRIARELRRQGARVSRINFNGGDWLDWRLGGTAYRGRRSALEAYLRDYCMRNQVDAIVMFGEMRPKHRIAARVARELGLDVHVLEEGYLRPFSVALEHWPKGQPWQRPGSLADCERRAATLPEGFAEEDVPAFLRHRVRDAVKYWVAATLCKPLFRHAKSHRTHTPAAELYLWLRRFGRRGREQHESRIAMEQLGDAPFFLFPLQLDGDAAITLRSGFSGMAAAMEAVLCSFAQDAPQDCRLVIKRHPYDPAATDWRSLAWGWSKQLGIEERVHFVEFADLDWLLDNARGVVAVNSTVGQLAVARGTPTLALGQALYALPGLVHDGDLASFWTEPSAPETGAYRLYTRALWAECLVNGGFHSRKGLAMLSQGAAARLLGQSGQGL